MFDTSRRDRPGSSSDWIVQHAQAPRDAEQLVSEGTAILGFEPLFCAQVGRVGLREAEGDA